MVPSNIIITIKKRAFVLKTVLIDPNLICNNNNFSVNGMYWRPLSNIQGTTRRHLGAKMVSLVRSDTNSLNNPPEIWTRPLYQ